MLGAMCQGLNISLIYFSSPVLVAPDANIDVCARRVIWGKCLNAGQTCICPDFVLCPRDKRDRLVAGMKKALADFHGEVS